MPLIYVAANADGYFSEMMPTDLLAAITFLKECVPGATDLWQVKAEYRNGPKPGVTFDEAARVVVWQAVPTGKCKFTNLNETCTHSQVLDLERIPAGFLQCNHSCGVYCHTWDKLEAGTHEYVAGELGEYPTGGLYLRKVLVDNGP